MHKNLNSKLTKRLKIIGGQVHGLEKMITDNAYCVDIITQSLAIKKALSSLEDAILENHLSTHVVEQMRSGNQKKATEEMVKIFKLSKHK